MHVADLGVGDGSPRPGPSVDGEFRERRLRRDGTTCYAVRSSDNADIWQRALPESGH